MLTIALLMMIGDVPVATIAAPATAAPGDLVILDASRSVGDLFIWESLDGAPCLPVDGGRRLVFASGRPGSFRFLLVVAGLSGARPALATARCTVKIEAPAPPLPPAPTPTPPAPTPPPAPGPAPVSGKLYATLVFNEPALTPEAAALRADAALGAALAALDCHWSECETSSAEFKARNLAPHAAGRALPVVIVQRAAAPPGMGTYRAPDGSLVSVVGAAPPAPVIAVFAATDAADVLRQVKALRGQK